MPLKVAGNAARSSRPLTKTSSGESDPRHPSDISAQIVEVATDAIISKDRSGVITSWNLGAERLYGYSAKEALGIPISFLIPKQLDGEEWLLLQRVLDGEHIDYYETRRLTKKGAAVSVSLTLFALRDGAGEIVGAASIAHDITKQVETQDELRRSEGRYRQILESAHLGVWQVTPEMLTDYVNPSMATMLGYAVEEMLGRPLSDFLESEGLTNARASIRRQSDGVGERQEQTLLCRDGSTVEVLMSVQLGGGTDIAQAVNYAGQIIGNPARSVVVLVTDFCEGGPPSSLVAAVRRLVEARVVTIGLASLDGSDHPAYDKQMAQRLADAGMSIAALTPGRLAEWLVEVTAR